MCGTMAIASGCFGTGNGDSGASSTDSISDASVPTYDDEISEKPVEYSVTVQKGEGYKITANSVVEVGADLTFDVEFDVNFDKSQAKVMASGQEVVVENGRYTVKNVSSDVTLSVVGLVRKSYSVLLMPTDGVILTGDSSVQIGGDYSFTVALENGVTKGEDFVVKANGVALTSNTDTYTLSAVDKDVIITVSGVNVSYYTVSGLQGEGYTVSVSADKVMQGKELSFAVNIDEAYEKSAEYSVSVVGGELTEENGKYCVKNVQSNVAISVSGISKRKTYTVTFRNCDLEPTTSYEGTLFTLPTPTRADHLFNGWKDGAGNDFVMDYSGNVVVYASWITDGGVDYLAACEKLAGEMETRYTTLESENKLNYLNVDDYADYTEYLALLAHYTEYEKAAYGSESQALKSFNAEVQKVANVLLQETKDYISLSYDLDGVDTAFAGYHGSMALKDGNPFNGKFYALQSPDPESPSLQYTFTVAKYNFKAACETYGRVSLMMSGNYAGMTLLCGETLLAYTMQSHVLQKIDIQDGYLYVNGICQLKLDEKVYTGEESLVFTVLRLENPTQYYAQWEISNLYAGIRMSEYSTEIGKNPAFVSVKENIFSNMNADATTEEVPAELKVGGAEKVYTYAYTAWANAALDDVELGEYNSYTFYMKATGNANLYVADSSTAIAYFDRLATWTEIKLTKNGSGYDLYVNGTKSAAISGVTSLNEIAFNGAEGASISYTNLIAEK